MENWSFVLGQAKLIFELAEPHNFVQITNIFQLGHRSGHVDIIQVLFARAICIALATWTDDKELQQRTETVSETYKDISTNISY